MSSTPRRYEIFLPLKYNDGKEVEAQKLTDITEEVWKKFGGVTSDTQSLIGLWTSEGQSYTDTLIKIFVDVEDTCDNNQWMLSKKPEWATQLNQKELYITSYLVRQE